MADMGCLYVGGCGVSSAEYSIHLVGGNRLSACREFFGVHSWQNGTKCMHGWCEIVVVSFPSSLVGS